jgi:2-polyprenyl-6-methoxyphenol hydroxylase-like FAD-dependent oxidoreductase
MNGSYQKERAVVIGASISGLLAARVLSNHFSQVTVIERDTLPEPGQPRKGVPQGKHAHVLLSRGRDLLEGFFPGLTDELVRKDAKADDFLETSLWFSGGAYTANHKSGLVGLEVSRPLLEETIYKRVCGLSNVTILENHDVVGLVTEPVGDSKDARITGVRVVDRSKTEAGEQVIPAGLVVDAAGRGTRSLGWLESLGYPRPEEEHIKMNLAYTTREFRRLREHANGHHPVVILASPNNRRGAVMMAAEGDRWIVTLAGLLGEAAPPDLPGFIEFARGLDAPDCYDILKSAEPLGEASVYKYPASQWRHFEKLSRFPEGFLFCGDAMCSFNPIYGQGMTTAATEAALLDECLSEGMDSLARRFYKRAAVVLASPWAIAAGSDLAYPEVEGKRAPSQKIVAAYLNRLLLVSQHDPVLNIAFQKVTNLIEPPASLFHPKIMKRVFFPGRQK